MNSVRLQYRAFISYSHTDEKAAGRLHRKLESFKLPAGLAGSRARRGALSPVFRDRSELASAGRLSDTIETALSDSEALIVICSPAACQSKWVNEEIRYFRRHHPESPVLPFVVAGKPELDPRQSEAAAFPLDLIKNDVENADSGTFDPLAADARPEADGFQVATLKLIAGLLGVGFDDLWRREHKARQRRWALLSAVLFSLSVVFGVLTWQATVARDEARRAQAAAQLELTSEQQTRRFLLSIFRLSGAGEARGNTVTVRSVLDRAVSTIDATDFAKPVVKSRLLATMGQAYSSLGLNQPSIELLRRSISLLGRDSEADLHQRIDSHTELADVLFDMGDYELAMAELAAAREEIAQSGESHALRRAHIENISGDIYSYSGELDLARAAYSKALELAETGNNPERAAAIRGRGLGGFALLAFFEGDAQGAVDYFLRAHEVLLQAFGSAHPDTNWALGSLGSAAKVAGDPQLARSSWESALDYAQLMYDPGNPEIGTLQNNIARLALEAGELDRAEHLLEQALESDRTHRAEDFDGLVYTLNNLAVVRIASGHFEEARSLLEEALPIAENTDHEMTGSVLTQLADVRCTQGQADEGAPMAARAEALLTEVYGAEDWRVARVRVTRHYCGGAGDPDQARALLAKRWGEHNPFVRRADLQLSGQADAR